MISIRRLSPQILAQGAFIIFAWLLLSSHATADNPGPFGWRPLALPFSWPAWQIGPLALLPLVTLFSWHGNGLKADGRSPQNRGRHWWFNGVLIALTFFLLPFGRPEQAYFVALLGLCWFVYLFLLFGFIRWPIACSLQPIALIAVGVLLVQGAVGIAQFFLQREWGLSWLGELNLDPGIEGVSVVAQNGTHLLRAYGINSHPNQYGLLMAVMLLVAWPYLFLTNRGWRFLVGLGVLSGLLGLLVSFSRSGWLAFLLGMAIYGWYAHRLGQGQRFWRRLFLVSAPLIVLFVFAGLFFAWQYAPAFSSRFLQLNSPLEQHSLWERQRDIRLAWELFVAHPWSGVGIGNYLATAQIVEPQAGIVHNIPLLFAAERGVVGLALWVLWMVTPWLGRGQAVESGKTAVATAVWCAMILISLVQPEPHLLLPKGAFLWGLAAFLWADAWRGTHA